MCIRDRHRAAPTGEAAARAHCCRAHIDAAAAMTGVSLFLQDDPRFAYSKAERGAVAAEYTHLVTARPRVDGFVLLHAEGGFERLQAWPPHVRLVPTIFVHESKRVASLRARGGI